MNREIKTRIISGFPGIGKSFAMKLEDHHSGLFIADSDSSKFDKAGFPANYMRHIEQIFDSGYKYIFVSSHADVRFVLKQSHLPFTVVYPDVKLKGEYLQRYIDRGSATAFQDLIYKNWEQWIKEIEADEDLLKIKLGPGEFLSQLLTPQTP